MKLKYQLIALVVLLFGSLWSSAEVIPAYLCRDYTGKVTGVLNRELWLAENVGRYWPHTQVTQTFKVERHSLSSAADQIAEKINQIRKADPLLAASIEADIDGVKKAYSDLPKKYAFPPPPVDQAIIPAGCSVEGIAETGKKLMDASLVSQFDTETDHAALLMSLAMRRGWGNSPIFGICLFSEECMKAVTLSSITIPTDREVMTCSNSFIELAIYPSLASVKFSDIDRKDLKKVGIHNISINHVIKRLGQTVLPMYKGRTDSYSVREGTETSSSYKIVNSSYGTFKGPYQQFNLGSTYADYAIEVSDAGIILSAELYEGGGFQGDETGTTEPLNCMIK